MIKISWTWMIMMSNKRPFLNKHLLRLGVVNIRLSRGGILLSISCCCGTKYTDAVCFLATHVGHWYIHALPSFSLVQARPVGVLVHSPILKDVCAKIFKIFSFWVIEFIKMLHNNVFILFLLVYPDPAAKGQS